MPESHDISVLKLQGTSDCTIKLISSLMVKPHIYPMIDQRIQTFSGAHNFFKLIESGVLHVYAFFQYGVFLGVVAGSVENNNTFVAHLFFNRGADVLKCLRAGTPVMVNEFKKQHYNIKYAAGYIPVYNRAAIRVAKRYGCVDLGEHRTIIKQNHEYPCRLLIKKLEE